MRTIYMGNPQLDLRTICSADDPVPTGEHTHKCRRCETEWRHSNDAVELSVTDFDIAHSCPHCGQEETHKHRVNRHDIRNAFEAFLAQISDEYQQAA